MTIASLIVTSRNGASTGKVPPSRTKGQGMSNPRHLSVRPEPLWDRNAYRMWDVFGAVDYCRSMEGTFSHPARAGWTTWQ